MQTDAPSRRRDRTAIGSSIALHACVLAVLLAAPRSATFPTEEPDERALLISIVRLHHPAPPPRIAARPAQPIEQRSVPAATPGPLHVTVARERSRRALVVAPERRYVAPASHPVPPRPHTAPVETVPLPAAPAPAEVARASAAPTSAPTPAVVAAAAPPATADRDPGQGNFGESYPARPMPGMLEALRAKAPRLVAHVTVDERGRATNVVVVAGADDAALREEITRALLAATYIPASCNGLSCTQTFDLRV